MPRNERFKLSGENDPQNLLGRYDTILQLISNDHAATAGNIADDHLEHVSGWINGSPAKKTDLSFEKILEKTENSVFKDAQYTEYSLDKLLENSAKTFPQVLSQKDRDILASAKAYGQQYGVNHFMVQNVLAGASSDESEQLIRSALDHGIWEAAKGHADMYGPTHFMVKNLVLAASSPNATQAMYAALDKKILDSIQEASTKYGPSHFMVYNLLENASDNQVISAMRAGLDKMIWNSVKHHADMYGPTHFMVTKVLDSSSTSYSRHAMQELLGLSYVEADPNKYYVYDEYIDEDQTPGEQRSNVKSKLAGFFRRWRESGEQPFAENDTTEEDYYEDYYYEPTDHSTQRDPRINQERERQDAARRSVDAEIESILQAVANDDRTESWLLTTDRLAVKRVINTVRVIRQKEAEKGQQITDRQIYLRYRKKVDQPEGVAPKEDIMLSFKILQSLMGGPNGQLPF